jgi:cation diffusion facilitator CzcD-associated flavoprotein CzcO
LFLSLEEKIPFDVIIFGTGYAAVRSLIPNHVLGSVTYSCPSQDQFPLQVHGIGGTIQEYFKNKEGPQAYRGTTYPNFPNFFTIFGGYASLIFLPFSVARIY